MAKRQRVGSLYIQKTGNWAAAIKTLEKLGPHGVRSFKEGQLKIANDFKTKLLNHIYAQDLNWKPLSDSTRDRKKMNNRKGLIYVDTETYINSILIIKKGNEVSVGIKRGQQYKGRKDRSVTVDQVAMWMEFGTRRAPARPLWQPTLEELGGAKGLRDKIASHVYKQIEDLIKRNKAPISLKNIRGGVR